MTEEEKKPEQKKAVGEPPSPESNKESKKDPEKDPEKVPKYVKPYKPTTGDKRSKSRRVVPWAAAAILIAAFAVLTYLKPSETDRGIVTGAALGGPFTLTDSNGRAVSDTDFRGKFMLVYFGYTFCPDICPTALTAMADTLDRLGEDGEKVVPLFITIDPERDTPEHLKEYISFFHPRQVALTGSADQIAAVAKSYGIFYTKDPVKGDGHDNHEHDHDYDMTHASTILLMGPDGKYRTHFRHGDTVQDMTDRIRKFL